MFNALLNTSVTDAESSLQCSINNGRAFDALEAVQGLIPQIVGKDGHKSRLKMLCKMGRKALTAIEKGHE